MANAKLQVGVDGEPVDPKVMRSIKRTPWKVDVCNRLARVREDIDMSIRANGWEITNMPGWACTVNQPKPPADNESGSKARSSEPIELVSRPDATPSRDEAEAVVRATFTCIAKTQATLEQSTRFWQRPWEWLTGGLLMSAYTSLHAAEANRILLLGSDQLAALLPTIRERAVKYLPANDPRLEALQGLPDPTAPVHQALATVQNKLVQMVTAGSSGADGGGGDPPNNPTAPGTDLVTLTGMLGRDQQIAAMAMGEATRVEDQQQSQVRRFRGVLLGTFIGLLIAVVLLAILGRLHPGYFPLCVHNPAAKSATTVCPTGSHTPGKADLAFIMAIGGLGAILAVAINLSGLKPTGVRYSLSVAQGLIKIPFGAITAMLGIIILSTQSNIGVLATHAGLLTTAAVFGYSQQLFTKFIDRQADTLLNQAGGGTRSIVAPPSGGSG